MLPDVSYETGQAVAAARAAGVIKDNGMEKPTKVVIDSELARAMGRKCVKWNEAQKPYVVTEPIPQAVD